MSQDINEAYTDVVELCALLQCLGFSVKSLDMSDANISQDAGGTRTVVINCQTSGLHVVLESASLSCSCPPSTSQQTSGVWQVSGMAGGKQLDKEFGCSLLGSLPKSHRDRLTKELHEFIKCIKQCNESDIEVAKEEATNRSASMVELKTPDKCEFPVKIDTPTRYRSLDTLTAAKEGHQNLPALRPLQKLNLLDDRSGDDGKEKKQTMCRRQSTYTLSSTPGSVRRRNKTSSPIQMTHSTFLESLIEAEKAAEELHSKLAYVIREYMDEGKNDSSISALALDVSKISVLKCAESSKAQFASSPNLSGLGNVKDDLKGRLKRFESASTSNLSAKSTQAKESKLAKLRRISPNIFKSNKESPNVKLDKTKDSKSKLNSLLKPKIVTPIRTPRTPMEGSPLLSSSKKKFGHIKSTIPRPSKKE